VCNQQHQLLLGFAVAELGGISNFDDAALFNNSNNQQKLMLLVRQQQFNFGLISSSNSSGKVAAEYDKSRPNSAFS